MGQAEFPRARGHADVRRWLGGALTRGRVSGAYLFAGPAGVGKSLVATEFAAALRCAAPAEGWSCGRCNECRRVAAGVHPSVRVFAKPADKADFPVELVREICDEASLKQLEPGRRVFVVQDADRFNESSANAFLKTLEEPPPDFVFVLLAGNLAEVLPTILSRCQPVRFAPLQDADMAEIARGWEGLPVNPQARAALVRLAQGSPGRLRAMAEAGVQGHVQQFLATVAVDPFRASEVLVEAVHEVDENEERRERLRSLLALLSARLRDRLTVALGLPDVLPLTAAVAAEAATADSLVAAIGRLDDLRLRVDGNANLKLACDAIALAYPAPAGT